MELYFRKNINITKIKLFAIDDAEMIVKNLHQGEIHRLADSLPKCQHLIFTNKYSEKIESMIQRLGSTVAKINWRHCASNENSFYM
jgi:hypothetical protein